MPERNGRVKIFWHRPTGETGVYEEPPENLSSVWYDEENAEWVTFLWSEGSYACDCNRAILFLGDHTRECSEHEFIIDEMWVQEKGTEEWVKLNYREAR